MVLLLALLVLPFTPSMPEDEEPPAVRSPWALGSVPDAPEHAKAANQKE
jgi:hypothetical protein